MDKNEAIKILRETHDKALFSVRTALETLIPDLKESEDERVRRELIEFLNDYRKTHEVPANKVEWIISTIAYLEKRNEQKPATPWTIQDARPGDILNSARVQATIIFKGFNPDGKHIDAYCALQKGIFIAQEMLWDRDFEPATQVRKDAIFDAMVRKGYLWDAENKRLNKAVQQPAEWSEEDEKMLDKVCCLISPGTILNAGNADYCLEIKQWVVSLQERILKLSHTQPKQEWSEEDERMHQALIHDLGVICEKDYPG